MCVCVRARECVGRKLLSWLTEQNWAAKSHSWTVKLKRNKIELCRFIFPCSPATHLDWPSLWKQASQVFSASAHRLWVRQLQSNYKKQVFRQINAWKLLMRMIHLVFLGGKTSRQCIYVGLNAFWVMSPNTLKTFKVKLSQTRCYLPHSHQRIHWWRFTCAVFVAKNRKNRLKGLK